MLETGSQAVMNSILVKCPTFMLIEIFLECPQVMYKYCNEFIMLISYLLVILGTPKHVETSWKSFESVFRFLTDKEGPIQKLKTSPKRKADSTPKKEGKVSKEKAEEGSKKEGKVSKEKAEEGSKKTEKEADISKGAEDTSTKSSEDSDIEAQT